MDTLDLGGIRLHVLVAWPGLPGESERVARAAAGLDPAIVLADLDTAAALRLREALAGPRPRVEPSFVDGLFAERVRERFGQGEPLEFPFLALGRMARDRRWDLVPLRPAEARPGFFARRRLARRAARADAPALEAMPAAFAAALEGAWDPAQDALAAEPRLRHALGEGRAPVLAVLQAHRAEAMLRRIEALGRIPA